MCVNMLKRIVGNSNYSIDKFGTIYDRNENIVDLPRQDDKVFIQIYRKEEWFSVTWLTGLAWYELFLPDEHLERIWEITFTPFQNKLSMKYCLGLIPVINKPIIIDEKYRLVLPYPRYAVSQEGELINIQTRNVIKPTMAKNDNFRYPLVSVYAPNRSEYANVVLHRLVAFAWCKNHDYYNRWQINHIDGNKLNYNAANLEWTTQPLNNLHAIRNGLVKNLRRIDIRDKKTGEVLSFQTLTEFREKMGVQCKWINLEKNLDKLGYELIDRHLLYPDIDPPYQVLDISTGVVEEFVDIMDIAKRYSIPKSAVLMGLFKGPEWVGSLGKYSMRPKSDDPWPDKFTSYIWRKQPVVATHDDGTIYKTETIKEMSDLTSIDRSIIRERLRDGKKTKGWSFNEK